MQKFQGKNYIFEVLTKIFVNTRCGVTSCSLPSGIIRFLPRSQPPPHLIAAASRIFRRPVEAKKEGEMLIVSIVLCWCFDVLTAIFLTLASSTAITCQAPYNVFQPQPTSFVQIDHQIILKLGSWMISYFEIWRHVDSGRSANQS